jgi:hypothetical protein
MMLLKPHLGNFFQLKYQLKHNFENGSSLKHCQSLFVVFLKELKVLLVPYLVVLVVAHHSAYLLLDW